MVKTNRTYLSSSVKQIFHNGIQMIKLASFHSSDRACFESASYEYMNKSTFCSHRCRLSVENLVLQMFLITAREYWNDDPQSTRHRENTTGFSWLLLTLIQWNGRHTELRIMTEQQFKIKTHQTNNDCRFLTCDRHKTGKGLNMYSSYENQQQSFPLGD